MAGLTSMMPNDHNMTNFNKPTFKLHTNLRTTVQNKKKNNIHMSLEGHEGESKCELFL